MDDAAPDRPADPELDLLMAWLDAKRRHVVQSFEGLDAAQATTPVVPSAWAPISVVRHLSLDVERFWFRAVVAGEQVELPTGREGWEVPDGTPVDDVLALYAVETAAADAVLRATPLDAAPAWWWPEGGSCPYATVREVLLHVLVETTTHAGHLDVVRELVDGRQRLVLD